MEEIANIVTKPTKVMLFRLVKHFSNPLKLEWLTQRRITKGTPQSIMRISAGAFEEVFKNAI